MSLDRLAVRSLRRASAARRPERARRRPRRRRPVRRAWRRAPASTPRSSSTVRDLVGSADLRVAAFGEDGTVRDDGRDDRRDPGRRGRRPGPRTTDLPRARIGADPTAALPPAVTILGIDQASTRVCTTLTLASGEALDDPAARTALISERLAAQDDLGIGSPVTIEGAGDRIAYRVVGILAGGGPSDGAPGGRSSSRCRPRRRPSATRTSPASTSA